MANNSQKKKKITVNKFTLEVRKGKKKKKKLQDLLPAQEMAVWQLWPSGEATARLLGREIPGPASPPPRR